MKTNPVKDIDVMLEVTQEGDEVRISIRTVDGTKLNPQLILDGVSDALLYEYGDIPSQSPNEWDS